MNFWKSIKGGTLWVGRGSNPWGKGEDQPPHPPPLNPPLESGVDAFETKCILCSVLVPPSYRSSANFSRWPKTWFDFSTKNLFNSQCHEFSHNVMFFFGNHSCILYRKWCYRLPCFCVDWVVRLHTIFNDKLTKNQLDPLSDNIFIVKLLKFLPYRLLVIRC